MKRKSRIPEEAPDRLCANWAEITECLDEFPPPETAIDFEGDISAKTWVFRGLKSSIYGLQPSIERMANSKNMEWPALELLAKLEFKARARIHLSSALIPGDGDDLTWLAQMQHYGIPTRLLDFTYSPFVALYFSVRNGHEEHLREHVRLWAVDAGAVNRRFDEVAQGAWRKEQGKPEFQPMSFNIDDWPAISQRDLMEAETQGLHTLIVKTLSATGTYRGEMNRNGCVCATPPPAFNPRLVNQQGLFLLNCAEDLQFKESLTKMMGPRSGWSKTFDIPVGLIPEIESRLFQMNVHEQSLFPDMEGLAGLIRQKMRL